MADPYISAISLVRDLYHDAKMARIMSLVMMIFVLVPALAPTIGQAILFLADWHAIFEFQMVYGITLSSWVFFRLRETLPKSNRIPFTATSFFNGFEEVLKNRITASYNVAIGLFFGSFIGYINSSQQIFQVLFNTGDMFAIYFGLLALILGSASLLNSQIVEKHGAKAIAFNAMFTISLSSLIFLLLHTVMEINLVVFLVYAATLFFCSGLLFGNVNSLAMEPMGHVAGIASAIIGSVSSVMSMCIGTVVGLMYNNKLIPLSAGFFIMGGMALAIMYWAEKGNMKPAHEKSFDQ